MTAPEDLAVLADLVELYRSPIAARHYDESVTQLDHGLQCAALAAADGASDALVVAALLHDVGHLLAAEDPLPATDHRHEELGARLLRRWFGPDVTAPVALHVAAKRHRCAVDPAHLAALSDASRHSLVLQGGPMDATERAAFERRPGWRDAVALRAWDDSGKRTDVEVRDLDHYVDLIHRVAAPG